MTPSLLKQYLQEKKQASLRDLVVHFGTNNEVVQDAMAFWIRKGNVELRTISNCDKGCCQCDIGLTILYIWK